MQGLFCTKENDTMHLMSTTQISAGVAHTLPLDLKKWLVEKPRALIAWEDITPLARNEWICWIEDAKKPETRAHRITRTWIQLIEGKRRPCCWAGCPHR